MGFTSWVGGLFGASTKSAPGGVGGGTYGFGYLDAYRSRRAPTQYELLQAYKNVAYACAKINAQGVASVRLRLYVRTSHPESKLWCPVKRLTAPEEKYLRDENPGTALIANGPEKIYEVLDHPIIDLLKRPNKFHNRFDLVELLVLYCEIFGNSYIYPAKNALGVPGELWPLESYRVSVIPDRTEGKVVDSYVYSSGVGKSSYSPDEILHFKYPGLSDPYILGWGPLRASFEQTTVSDKLLAYEEAVLDNRARPDMLISPRDPIGKAEAERLEAKIRQRFTRGGQGGVIIGESGLDYKALVFPPSDLAALEIRKVSKEEIANAFDVPISMLRTEDVNRANAEAGHYFHAKNGILPRCRRIEEKLNQQLIPMFRDERLFLAFDNPVPEDVREARETRRANIAMGVKSINEERAEMRLPPVPWGDVPFLQGAMLPADVLAGLRPNPMEPKPAAEPGEPGNPPEDEPDGPADDESLESGGEEGTPKWCLPEIAGLTEVV